MLCLRFKHIAHWSRWTATALGTNQSMSHAHKEPSPASPRPLPLPSPCSTQFESIEIRYKNLALKIAKCSQSTEQFCIVWHSPCPGPSLWPTHCCCRALSLPLSEWNRENILVCYYLFIQIVAAVSVAVAGFVFVAVSHLTPKNTHSHNPELGHNSTRRVCSLPRTGMISYTGGALSPQSSLQLQIPYTKYLIYPKRNETETETETRLRKLLTHAYFVCAISRKVNQNEDLANCFDDKWERPSKWK